MLARRRLPKLSSTLSTRINPVLVNNSTSPLCILPTLKLKTCTRARTHTPVYAVPCKFYLDLTFTPILLYRFYHHTQGLIDPDEWMFLLTGGLGGGSASPNPAPAWLVERGWREICKLSRLPAFGGLDADFAAAPDAWQPLHEATEPHKVRCDTADESGGGSAVMAQLRLVSFGLKGLFACILWRCRLFCSRLSPPPPPNAAGDNAATNHDAALSLNPACLYLPPPAAGASAGQVGVAA